MVYPDVPRLHVPIKCVCSVAALGCGNAIEEHRVEFHPGGGIYVMSV